MIGGCGGGQPIFDLGKCHPSFALRGVKPDLMCMLDETAYLALESKQ